MKKELSNVALEVISKVFPFINAVHDYEENQLWYTALSCVFRTRKYFYNEKSELRYKRNEEVEILGKGVTTRNHKFSIYEL